jgi:hypothetical protein
MIGFIWKLTEKNVEGVQFWVNKLKKGKWKRRVIEWNKWLFSTLWTQCDRARTVWACRSRRLNNPPGQRGGGDMSGMRLCVFVCLFVMSTACECECELECMCVCMYVYDLVWKSVRREQKGLEESRICENKQPTKWRSLPSLFPPSYDISPPLRSFASTHLWGVICGIWDWPARLKPWSNQWRLVRMVGFEKGRAKNRDCHTEAGAVYSKLIFSQIISLTNSWRLWQF